MTNECSPLADGTYENLSVDIVIKNGKATVNLFTSFELPVGTEITLERKEATILVKSHDGGTTFNGHSII